MESMKDISKPLEVGSSLASLSNQGSQGQWEPRMSGGERQRPGKTGQPGDIDPCAAKNSWNTHMKQKRSKPQGVLNFQTQFLGFLLLSLFGFFCFVLFTLFLLSFVVLYTESHSG